MEVFMNLKRNFLILTSLFIILGCNLALATTEQTPTDPPAETPVVSGESGESGEVTGSGEVPPAEEPEGTVSGESGEISGDVSGEVSGEISGDGSGDVSGEIETILASTALDSTFTININETLSAAMEASVSGDETFNFVVVTEPANGILVHENSGDPAFTYTPSGDFIGLDSFAFRLESGEYYSNIGTVTIEIVAPSEPVIPFYYEDMQDHWANFSASHLAARGFIIGEEIGNNFYYWPDKQMSRGEFLLFLLSVLNIDETANAAAVTFADEDSIPDWMLEKAKIAYEMEIISGVSDDTDSLYLYPNAPITRAEAFVMINNALLVKTEAVNTTDAINYADAESIPSWATQAIKNLSAYQIIQGSSNNNVNPNSIASRGEAAELCYKLLKQIEASELTTGSGDLK